MTPSGRWRTIERFKWRLVTRVLGLPLPRVTPAFRPGTTRTAYSLNRSTKFIDSIRRKHHGPSAPEAAKEETPAGPERSECNHETASPARSRYRQAPRGRASIRRRHRDPG